MKGATIVVLSSKPQQAAAVVEEIRPHVSSGTLIISVLAGVKAESLREAFGQNLAIVRTMPNTPMIVGEGASAIAGGRFVTSEHLALTRMIFEGVGTVEEVFRLATQTVYGAAKLVRETGKHPAILRDEVTTPRARPSPRWLSWNPTACGRC